MSALANRWIAGLLIALLLAPASAFAQGTRAGVVTTLEGHVTARRVALPAPVPLKFRDDVFLRDTITTGDRSLARMLLGGKAVVTVRERSVLTITEIPGRTTIALASGKFALAVAREKLQPGEQIDITTPNAVAGVRGTVVITEVERQGAQLGAAAAAVLTSFFVLRGSIEAQPFDSGTGQRLGTPLQVGTLQSYSGAGLATPRLLPIRPEQVSQINEGLQPTGPRAGSETVNDALKTQAVQTAAILLAVLAGDQAVLNATVQPPPPPPADTTILERADVGIADITPLEQISDLPALIAPFSLGTPFNGTFESTSSSPLFQLTGPQASAGSFLTIGGSGNVSLQGPLAQFVNSVVSAGGSLLEIVGGSLVTSVTADALLILDPTTINAQHVLAMNGGALTLSGPLLTDLNGTIFTEGEFVRLANGAVLTGTGSGALVQLDGTDVDGTGALTMSSSAIDLRGPLLVAANLPGGSSSLRSIGSSADVPMFLIDDGSVLTSAGASALIQLSALNLDSDQSIVRIANGSSVSLRGSLLNATDALVGTPIDLVHVERARLTTTATADPLVSLDGALVLVGATSGVDGHLLRVESSEAPGAAASPATVSLTGPLLEMKNNAVVSSASDTIGIFNGARFTATGGGALARLTDASLFGFNLFEVGGLGSTGGTTRASATSAGPILSAKDSTIGLGSNVIGIFDGGELTATTTLPLISLDNSSLTAGLAFTGAEILQVNGGTSPALVTLRGPVLRATNGSEVFTPGALFGSFSGGRLVVNGSTSPLFFFSGGAHAFGTATGLDRDAAFILFGLGTEVASEVALGNTLTLGTRRPLVHGGALLEALGPDTTLTTNRLMRIDTALLQASAPLLNLRNGSTATITLDAVDLTGFAKVTTAVSTPLLRVDASVLNVLNGSAVRVAAGSFLNVLGDLFTILNGGTLNITNGGAIHVTGNSVVNINGALVRFGGTSGNQLTITNTACQNCSNIGGLTVDFRNGANPNSGFVTITNPIKNGSLGFLNVSNEGTSTGSTAVIIVDGPGTKLRIAGN